MWRATLGSLARELPTAILLLVVVALCGRYESCRGPIAPLVQGAVFSALGKQGTLLLVSLGMPGLGLRWIRWCWVEPRPVAIRERLGGLAGAVVGVLFVAAGCWAACPWLALSEPWCLRSDLSRELLVPEAAGVLVAALALAAAPAGLVQGLLARPAHTVMAVAALALVGLSPDLFWPQAPGRYSQFGWGRLLLLGSAAGLGFAAGGRLAKPPAFVPCVEAPWPTRPACSLLLLLLPGASLGAPGRPFWACLLGKYLGKNPPLQGLEGLWERAPILPAAGLLQLVVACHLARAWRHRWSTTGEVLLASATALQLLILPMALAPARLDSVLTSPLLLVPPWVGFSVSVWVTLALCLFWLRVRSHPWASQQGAGLLRDAGVGPGYAFSHG